ncbi:hypothetical protein PISMIDRAFT_9168 [Pisolithus microcarpus 441]|uniref:Uncharacterized protein n=1 Tax=Pisolithus microcarpus 441 TaxID=765257 RepID=A0A0D0A2E4_9AGAM|nr:hypothetical protein PISMIDRAFT_9168 [Pisolithus microcarpus 441]
MPFSEQKSTLRAVLLAHRSVRVIIGGNSRPQLAFSASRYWLRGNRGSFLPRGYERDSTLAALATKRRIRPAPDLSGFEANGSKGKARLPPLILSTKDGKDHRA